MTSRSLSRRGLIVGGGAGGLELACKLGRKLGPGGVLVVGASSSGVQIADELVRSGRDVVLAVGRHTRVPRRYRGMDIYWWLQVTGRLARTIDTMPRASTCICWGWARRGTSIHCSPTPPRWTPRPRSWR